MSDQGTDDSVQARQRYNEWTGNSFERTTVEDQVAEWMDIHSDWIVHDDRRDLFAGFPRRIPYYQQQHESLVNTEWASKAGSIVECLSSPLYGGNQRFKFYAEQVAEDIVYVDAMCHDMLTYLWKVGLWKNVKKERKPLTARLLEALTHEYAHDRTLTRETYPADMK